MIALSAVAGGLTVGGLLLLLHEFSRPEAARHVPRWGDFSLRPATRKRSLLAAAAATMTLTLTRWPVAGVAAGAAVLLLPGITSAKAARQQAAILEGLEQWTRRVADMLAAGRGLEDALEVSVRSAPPAIEGAVSRLGRRLSARTGTETALRAFAADIGDPAGDRIAAALIIATGRRGGGVRAVLNSLAVMVSKDVAARREIEADRAQHRTTVRWLTAFVAGFTAFAVLNRSYSAPYGTVPGQVVLALVSCLYAGGLGWLHWLGSVPAPGRFLAETARGRRRT